jgi:DNA polymerase V
MTGAGLFPGDIAVIDRSVTPTPGCIVLALLDGEFTIKRYRPRDGKIVLQAENPAFPDIEVTPDRAFEVWGVVTKAIRMLSP